MIDGLYSALEQAPPHHRQPTPQKTLRMVKNDRMAGSIPAWEKNTNPVEASLSRAATNAKTRTLPESALSYKAPEENIQTAQGKAFDFGDLVDMINPLHHIPIAGPLYRELTGDEIKPIGKIMGGALFGGPLGAAAGLVNLIAEHETGKDITGNAIAFVSNGDAPHFHSRNKTLHQSPKTRLAGAQTNTMEDIPGNLLAFVDMKTRPEIVIQRTPAANGRTAGTFTQKSYPSTNEKTYTPREPITQVRFNT